MVLLVIGHSGTLVTVCLSPTCLPSNQLMLIYNRHRIIFKIFFSSFLAELHSLWDLSSPTRDQAGVPAVRVPSPNVWTTVEFPLSVLFKDTAESEP